MTETLNQASARAESLDQTSGKLLLRSCHPARPMSFASGALRGRCQQIAFPGCSDAPAPAGSADMLRRTLRDVRRELQDKSRRLEDAYQSIEALGAEITALRARAATDDATVRRLQARVDLLDSLGRMDGATAELRRLEAKVVELAGALEEARLGRRVAEGVAETSKEQLKVRGWRQGSLWVATDAPKRCLTKGVLQFRGLLSAHWPRRCRCLSASSGPPRSP